MTLEVLTEVFDRTSRRVFIIAEAGVNHNGNLQRALDLVDAAVDCEADCVKFQTFRGGDLVTQSGEMAAYQKVNLGVTKTQKQMLEDLSLPEDFYQAIVDRCKERKIIFLSTPHGGFNSVRFLETFGVSGYKLGSGDLTNIPLLEFIAKLGKPMIVSTGMAVKQEIDEAVAVIEATGNDTLILLHCTSNYPCPRDAVNLRAMVQMIKDFKYPIGYSDHTLGTDVSVYACLLGARVIEKHLTLDRKLPGPDQVNSLEPTEFKTIVAQIREVETLSDKVQKQRVEQIPPEVLGLAIKNPNDLELEIARQVRKSVVYVRDLKSGHSITKTDLDIKRPATGIHPREYKNLIGKTLSRNVSGDTVAQEADFS